MAGSAWSALEKMALKSSTKPSTSTPAKNVADLDGPSNVPSTPRNQGKGASQKGRSPPEQNTRSPKRSKTDVQIHEVPDDDIPVISIDSLGATDFERFKKEPMVVCAWLCMGVGKAIQEMTDKAEEVRAERDAAHVNLGILKKKLEKAVNSKKAALEARNQAEEDKAKLTKRNKDLAAQVKELKNVVEVLEKDKADLENRVQEVAGLAKDAAVYQFQNALDQVRILNSEANLNLDEKVLSADHRVEDNEIVLPELTDDQGNVTRQRSSIY